MLGTYKELAYQISKSLALDEIATTNKVLLDNLETLDTHGLAYAVYGVPDGPLRARARRDIILAIHLNREGSRISIARQDSSLGLDKRLHHIVTPEVLLAWLVGGDHAVAMTSMRFYG